MKSPSASGAAVLSVLPLAELLPQAPKNTFSMITHDCIFDQLFRKYGIPELTSVFCHVDDIIYDSLPGADFVYTQQIGNGGSCCDYSFVRK